MESMMALTTGPILAGRVCNATSAPPIPAMTCVSYLSFMTPYLPTDIMIRICRSFRLGSTFLLACLDSNFESASKWLEMTVCAVVRENELEEEPSESIVVDRVGIRSFETFP
jgi:hypothetical protein